MNEEEKKKHAILKKAEQEIKVKREQDKISKAKLEQAKKNNQEYNDNKIITDSKAIDRGFATGETKKFVAPEPRGG